MRFAQVLRIATVSVSHSLLLLFFPFSSIFPPAALPDPLALFIHLKSHLEATKEIEANSIELDSVFMPRRCP